MVGVLVLIHQNITEFVLIISAHILMLLQQLNGNEDNIIKIQCIVGLQLGLILIIGPGNMHRPDITVFLGPVHHLLRRNHIVLFLADGIEHIFMGKGFIIQAHVLDNIFHNALGVRGIVDCKTSGIAHPFNIPAENPAAGRMEGHSPDVVGLGAQQHRKPLLQFVGSLIGKGNGQNLPGSRRLHRAEGPCQPGLMLRKCFRQILQKFHVLKGNMTGDFITVAAPAEADQICDPVNQNRGFAASGTGQQQQRAFCSQNRLLLLVIQLRKLGSNVSAASCEKSLFK